MVVDQEGTIRLVNSCAEELIGVDRCELVGRSVESLIPERLRNSHGAMRAEFHSTSGRRPMGEGRELFLLRPDGQERRVEIGLGSFEADGETFAVCCLRDVSDLKVREEHLQELVDAMPGLFYIFDPEGRLTWWKKELETVLGYSS